MHRFDIFWSFTGVVPVLNGASQEWALARRHKSEDIFGVQLCGNNAELITFAAQLLSEKCDIDYFGKYIFSFT